MTFTNNFINTDGSPYSPNVSDLFVPETLGYTYGLAAPLAASLSSCPNLLALKTNLTTLWSTPSPNNASVKDMLCGSWSRTDGRHGNKPTDGVAQCGPGADRLGRQTQAGNLRRRAVELRARAGTQAGGTRVLAFLRDVDVTDPEQTEYRLFLDAPGEPAQSQVSEPGYVGNFGIFVHGDHRGHGDAGSKPSLVLGIHKRDATCLRESADARSRRHQAEVCIRSEHAEGPKGRDR